MVFIQYFTLGETFWGHFWPQMDRAQQVQKLYLKKQSPIFSKIEVFSKYLNVYLVILKAKSEII